MSASLEAVNAEIDALHERFPHVLSDSEATERGIEVPTLEVDPAMRGMGLGTAFMKGLLEIAGRHGTQVLVAPSGHSQLVGWYRSLGFEWPQDETACRTHDILMMAASPRPSAPSPFGP